ncbi:hypothetical protein GCM10023081_28070 [Arthrobacter ginkgonis]|uniref:Right handed beta helix domain-containing protein n=1 Tax=Arthrobacter ginkgonis TaxID=1630594 RepID=A0ABP7CIX9_9MICC
MTADVSRSFADRDKLFHAVVRQQGRLPTDAEETHSAELGDWTHDSEFVETITPLGTPDDGFKIVVPTGVDDGFAILPGSYYLGGARVENPGRLAYADQVDGNWLTQDEPVGRGSRVLVWLEVEERVVTGVQDAELLEPALRGADGSGRTRLCWRVRQAPTTWDDCGKALAEVLAPEAADALDPLTGAIASPGTLTIGFDDTDADLDLCKPAVEPGYLGNRNNCYRIKRTRPGFFVWGEDNAAQLYRVTVGADKRTIRFLTEPRDEYLRPRPGQTVELLRGDVLLPNYERIAELDGDYFRVTGGYQDGSIQVGSDVKPSWLTWLATSPLDPAAPAGTKRHLYVRVWTGGGVGADPAVPFTIGTGRTLVGTGLTVTFDGATLPGDGWTVSARPDAPARVLPWALREGMRAHGPRRHVAALAIVDLKTGDVHDCRERFRPLHKIRTCCTITVGPPGTHVGDVDSIADALALVPPEGGTVCLLAGRHPANVVVDGRRDLRFTGCPGKTTWVPKDPDEPLVCVIDTMGIGFSDIVFESGTAPAIVAGRRDPSDDVVEHGGLLVQDCVFVAPAGCAVLARSMEGTTLLRCRVLAGPFPEATRLQDFESLPAVFLQGKGLVVERCEVRARREQGMVPGRLVLGGVQIGGGSLGVTIRDCLIEDGAGIGITLGSIMFLKVGRARLEREGDIVLVEAVKAHASSDAGSVKHGWQDMLQGFRHVTGEAGCIGVEPVDPDPTGGGEEVEVPVSEGMVEDVEILHNRVLGMGSSGIATYPLGLLPDRPIGDAVTVSRLLIADNLVADNLQFEVNVDDKLLRAFFPVGGIALAVALDCVLRGNEILRNGSEFGGGTCGIGIVYGEDVRVADNRIEDNGRFDAERVVAGPNAGVHLSAVKAGIGAEGAGAMAGSDTPALTMHGNIVSQPAGRALRALALGPVMVNDNRLVGGNRSRLFAALQSAATHLQYAQGIRTSGSGFDLSRVELILDLLGGDAVNLVNLAVATDLALIQKDASGRGMGLAEIFAQVVSPSTSVTHLPATNAAFQFRCGGPTMFHDNQVSLHRPLPDGPPMTLSAIFIGSSDDVGFADNQFGIEPDSRFAVIDALILGVTVRITGNRGQEAVPTVLSVASLARVWNSAALNQTTRPIHAVGLVGSQVQLNLNA